MSSKKLMDKMYENDINAFIGLDYSHMGYWQKNNSSDFKIAQEESLRKLFEGLNITADQTILDIGGGQGETSIWLHKNYGCKVVVVDIVQEMINAGIYKVKEQNLDDYITFHCMDFLQFETDLRFDAIISVEALHHIKNTETLLNKCYKLLKADGRLCASVYVAHFRPKWLLDHYLLLTVGDKNLPLIDDYKSSAKLSGFNDVQLQDVSHHVLLKSSQVLREEPYMSRIRDYHVRFYGKISKWVMPLFLKVHDYVLRKNQLQLFFINCTKASVD